MAASRRRLLWGLLFITPLGFLSKFYSGPLAWWSNNYLGGVFYVIFWMLLLCLFRPETTTLTAALTVFLVTSSLEFLQLWHPVLLQEVRANFWGRTLIGTTFNRWDFLHYFLGSIFGWFWLRFLQKQAPGKF